MDLGFMSVKMATDIKVSSKAHKSTDSVQRDTPTVKPMLASIKKTDPTAKVNIFIRMATITKANLSTISGMVKGTSKHTKPNKYTRVNIVMIKGVDMENYNGSKSQQ
jgi:hypothetical protein